MDRIRVFITEDESIVREGLRDMIPWNEYGFEFVGDAPDGEIALPLLRRLKPDLLITDIKMPFMDGISLSQIIRRELPDTKIIILSGYDNFEYARKGIELNVDQFLLKPITKSEMIQALGRVRAHIEEEQEQKHYLEQYERELKQFERFSRRDFFEKLVDGSLSVQEIYEQAEKLHLDLTAEQYNFVVFTLQDAGEGSFSNGAENALNGLLNYFLRYPDYIFFRCSLLSYALLVKGERERLQTLTQRGVDAIRQRCEGAETALNWYVAVGTPTSRLSTLAQCYANANHVLAYRHIFPGQHIFTSEMLKVERESGSADVLDNMDPGKIDPMILRGFVQNATAEEVDSFVQEYLGGLSGAERSVILRHYLLVSVRVNAELALREAGCQTEEFMRRIPPLELNLQPERLREDLCTVLRIAVEQREEESQRQSNGIVNEVLNYLNANYTDAGISLSSVAEANNISASYLSALFSQKVGLSFVEYLTEKRMARARQLLRQTGKRAGEIAAEVGYRDPRYFSFVFKKTQGCTPSSYRLGEEERL